ncbi:PspC domain-containing protein [Paenibacillaceae bacterium]|nr:PspC domain-containing protein [Paenibacillaceae bacterium]
MRKLYRSRRDKAIAGVCGGIAEYTGIDVTLIRVGMVILTIFSVGTMLFLYLIAALVIPLEPTFIGGGYGNHHNHHNHGGPAGYAPPEGAWSSYNSQGPSSKSFASSSNIDAVMDDLEKAALRKELEQYRAKLSKFEKGEL